MVEFWFYKPDILLNKNYITEIWIQDNMSLEQKVNALTRLIILLNLVGFFIYNHIFFIGLLFIFLIVIYLFYKEKKETFSDYKHFKKNNKQKYTDKNPFKNVLMTDYVDNPGKLPQQNVLNEISVESDVKKIIYDLNKDNTDNYKLFESKKDDFEFNQSLRQFTTNPETTIDQSNKDFLSFCYGSLYSEKPLRIY